MSYGIYKEMFGSSINILLVPDIAFTLCNDYSEKRSGLCVIFRKDKERLIDKRKNTLLAIMENKYSEVSYNDTCDVCISNNGYNELSNYINFIKRKELIITDRLHGMILSYVTKTPCIVFDNNNHKIMSTYETWLKKRWKNKFC